MENDKKKAPKFSLTWVYIIIAVVLGYLMKAVMFRLRGFGGYYGQGFQEALKVIGKIEKPKFRLKNLPNYVFIQLWLVVGLFQYIVYRAQRALKIT